MANSKYCKGNEEDLLPPSYDEVMSQDFSIISAENEEEGRQLIKLPTVYTVNRNRVKNCQEFLPQENWFYGGSYYANRFRVSRPIFLQQVGFYGPCGWKGASASSAAAAVAATAKYDIHIEIFKGKKNSKLTKASSSACKQCIFSKQWVNKAVKVTGQGSGQCETFYVDLVDDNNSPLFIEKNTWYLIKFKLEGETPTGRCLSTLDSVTVPLVQLAQQQQKGENHVKFSFEPGGKQMPELRFFII